MKYIAKLLVLSMYAVSLAGCAGKSRQAKMSIAEFTFDTLPYPRAPQLLIDYEKEDFSEGRLTIENSSSDANMWRFTYPDSLYPQFREMQLRTPSGIDSLIYDIGFMKATEKYDYNNTKFLSGRVNTKVSLKHFSTDTIYVQRKLFIHTYYTVEDTDDQELLSSLSVTYDIGWTFAHRPGAAEKWAEIASKYPDSQFFIAMLAQQMFNIGSKENLRMVFDKFSEEKKAGYFGDKISRYLATTNKFENMELPAWDTGKPEPIIEDFSKPNLVIFSASWCVNCHRIIPIYKEIYEDLNEKLNMVYVSIDEPEFAERWSKTMKDNEIPWRSVIAHDKSSYVMYTYFISAIPYSLLVYPDGTMEKIDVRKADQKAKLYGIFENYI